SVHVMRDITEQKRAEEDIRKFKTIADNTAYGVAISDMTGHLIYANDSYAQMHGYTVDELIGQNIFALYPENQQEFMTRRIERIKETGSAVGELIRKRKDGTIFPTLSTGTLVKDDQGKPLYIASSHFDLTERKKTEEALKISEDKFSRAFHSNPYPMSLVTMEEGRYLDVNDSYVQIFGFSREELLGRTTVEMGIAKTRRFRIRLLQILGKKQAVKNLEVEFYTKSGRKVDALLSADKIEIGGETCLLSVINDVTERKQAQEEISKFKTIADEASYGVVISDLDNIIVYVNATFADWHGYKPDELIGQPLSILFTEDQYKVLTERRKKILQAGRITPTEIWRKKKDGTIFSTLSSGSIVKDDKGRLLYIAATHFDLTERKKMEEQLMVTDRLASIGELASGIAHEINNPLTSVIGFTELLAEREVPDDIKDDLLFINKEAQRTAQIVQNLLTFARKHKQEKELLNINDAILNVLELRAYELRVNKIEVNTQLATNLPKVMANIFQLRQVFLNLIINAEYFMIKEHNRGNLTITTETVGNLVRTSIADDGPGVAKGNIEHLFDPFFTTKEVGKGTGLGLSICHGIITEHDGRIYVESEPGKGATFIVELPVFKKRQKEVK
ncbi:MAG: PAS domain S-box protein, partial [Thermoplasmata archaeon]